MGVYLRIAARNLKQGGRRTVLLGLALLMVTGLLVTLMALSTGINTSMVEAATSLSAGHVNIAGFYKPTAGNAAPILSETKKIKQIAIDNTPGLVRAVDRHRGWVKVVSHSGSTFAGLHGLDVAQETVLFDKLQMAPESEYRDDGDAAKVGDPRQLTEPDTVVVFASQARRLDVTVGDTLTFRTETLRGQSNTADLRVVGVARDMGLLTSWAMLVPKGTIHTLYGMKPETTGQIMLYLDDIDRAPEVMAHLRKVYEAAGYDVLQHDPQPFFMKFETIIGQGWTGQKLDLTIWRDEVSFLTWVITAVDSVSFLLIGILAIIIAIGIMNTQYIAVRERTREIGTLRAIGMSRRAVLGMFVLEALLLGVGATTAGALLAALTAMVVNALHLSLPWEAAQAILMSDHIRMVVDPGQVLTAIAAFTGITGLAALWPAARAARLPPITAIHQTE
jgi:putative ABC transport system permease protein